MLAYTTKNIEWLYNGSDNLIKRIVRALFFSKKPCYGESTIKRYGIKFKRSKAEQQEWDKCKFDIVYFAEKYIKIFNPVTGNISQLRDYQKDLLFVLTHNDRVIVANSRQMGLTTIHKIYAIWLLLFHSDKIQILNPNMSQNNHMMSGLREIYRNIPYFLQKGVKAFSKTTIELDDSIVTCARLQKPTMVLADNAGYYSNGTSNVLQNILETKSKCLISSTPYIKNLFYDLYTRPDKYKLKDIRIHYSIRQDLDDNWIKNMQKWLGIEAFNNEFNLMFKSRK